MTAKRRLWPVLLATVIAFLMLMGLGVWQLQRLTWKTAVLADIAAREAAAPITLAAAEQRRVQGDSLEFLKVTARGAFLHDQEKLMLSTIDGHPGWDVITPLVTADGHVLLVDRGTVPDERRDSATRREANPSGEVDVTGLVKMHTAARTMFMADNNVAANQWIWWDMPALIAATQPPAGMTVLPYALHAIPGGPQYPLIVVREPASGISNNHLQYVVTWIGLAAALLAVAGIYVRGQMKKPDA
jgi:surfeit locus 1 family protein